MTHTKPTPRQIKAVEHLLENGGSSGDAIPAAGYSAAMPHNPDQLFNSPAILAMLEEAGINAISVL